MQFQTKLGGPIGLFFGAILSLSIAGSFIAQSAAAADPSDTCWLLTQGLAPNASTAQMNRSDAVKKIAHYTADLLRVDPSNIASGSDNSLGRIFGYEDNIVSYLIKLARKTSQSKSKNAVAQDPDQIVAYSVPFTEFRTTVETFGNAAHQDETGISAAGAKRAEYDAQVSKQKLEIERKEKKAEKNHRSYKYVRALTAATLTFAVLRHLGAINVTGEEQLTIAMMTAIEGAALFYYNSFAKMNRNAAEDKLARLTEFQQTWYFGELSPYAPDRHEISVLLDEELKAPNGYIYQTDDFDLLGPVDRNAADAEVTVIFKNQSLIDFFNKKKE
jgi:hypothetical protein